MNSIEFRLTSSFRNHKIQYLYGIPASSETQKRTSATDYIKVQIQRDSLPIEPSVGQQWIVTGDSIEKQSIRNNRLYNDVTFKDPSSIEITLPSSDEGFIYFISNEIDYVSEVKARNIWQTHGQNIYSILRNQDKQTLLDIKGLGEKAVDSLLEGYKKYSNLASANWLARHRVPLHVQKKLFKYHSNISIEAIKQNPYCLVTFGMVFNSVDEIARDNFQVMPCDDNRLSAAARQAMTNLCRSKGHTYIKSKSKLISEISKLIGPELAIKAMNAGKRLSAFATFKQLPNCYFNHDLLLVEASVARHLARLVTADLGQWSQDHSKALKKVTNELPYPLTDKQELAVKNSLYLCLSLITGGAGTGKTTVTRTVLRAYQEMGFHITAIALSGKAAKRLHESIGFKTSTIAKFLRGDALQPVDTEGNEAKYVLVIDESSMVDIASMYRIVNHITADTRLIFVGDPYQLPPIAAGLVLSELDSVESVDKTHLDIVKRQEASTGIPEYSEAIRNGQMPSLLSTGAIEFHNTTSLDTVVELFSANPDDSMVVAATNKSVDSINLQLQKRLNPNSPSLKYKDRDGFWNAVSGGSSSGKHTELILKLNDPVIFIQNNYDAGYQNGSLGLLTSVTQDAEKGTYGTVLLEDGEEIKLSLAMLDHLRAAYAITLHKAQGSQFRNCIVYLDNTPMVDRSWLYTAVTRSEKSLNIVGSKDKFRKAVNTLSAFNMRNAHLGWLLKEYIDLYTVHATISLPKIDTIN